MDSAAPELDSSRRNGGGGTNHTSLRWQLTFLTSVVMIVTVTLLSITGYWMLSSSLKRTIDADLRDVAAVVVAEVSDPAVSADPALVVAHFKQFNPKMRIAYYPMPSAEPLGDDIATSAAQGVFSGAVDAVTYSDGSERILAQRAESGAVVIAAKDAGYIYAMIRSLVFILVLIAFAGVVVAVITGRIVSATALRPLERLQEAVDHVTETDDLKQIAPSGNDELSQLTQKFNDMLAALQASRQRQSQLVADAGHELKTPLTSLRTNIELLMMITRSPDAVLSEEDRFDLERDVVGQIEEMSNLIGDLVDLAREDGPQMVSEVVSIPDILEQSLDRVKRRRPDVKFSMELKPWFLEGDAAALGRATLNLMDNAAKWSPSTGVVRVKMVPISPQEMEISFSDSGPGIPLEDREKVFERFYRSAAARAMPGSGLGLAIVKQVILRHHGTIEVGDSDDNGAKMTVVLPGATTPDGLLGVDSGGYQDGRGGGEIYANDDKTVVANRDTSGSASVTSTASRNELFGRMWDDNIAENS
ncbi:MAG: HAMP domain-containing sensor histidine kinase [Corynebacterium sp.]|nr:HAMP domain-containing sensor histidine kinase [Corynebacterium sp.]